MKLHQMAICSFSELLDLKFPIDKKYLACMEKYINALNCQYSETKFAPFRQCSKHGHNVLARPGR